MATSNREVKRFERILFFCLLGVVCCSVFWVLARSMSNYESPPAEKREPEFFDKIRNAAVYDWSYDDYGRELLVMDDDNDDRVDVISATGHPEWISLARKEKTKEAGNIGIMDEEMIELATQVLRSQKELAKLLAQKNYEHDKALATISEENRKNTPAYIKIGDKIASFVIFCALVFFLYGCGARILSPLSKTGDFVEFRAVLVVVFVILLSAIGWWIYSIFLLFSR